MRKQEEIIARVEAKKDNDLLGFETGIYYVFLDYEHAKKYAKPGVTQELWEADMEKKTPAECIKTYMPFAWEKANDCRGISANRSIEHFIAWIWLDGDDTGWLEDEYKDHYEHYGKPQLVKICEKYSIGWRELDNGRWTNGEDD